MISHYTHQLDLHGPPGPPPRPGLAWKEETHRWIRPEDLKSQEDQSSLNTTAATIGDIYPMAIKRADKYLPSLDWKALSTEAFGVGISGYSTVIREMQVKPSVSRPSMIIHVEIRFDDEKVGTVSRIIEGDKVEHLSFFLDEDHRNKGVAADMLERMETAYIKHGLKRITLMANDEVGGYAWARQGFDFIDENARREGLDNEADHTIRNMHLGEDKTNELMDQYLMLEHAWEIAAWNPTNEKPGEHLGKTILMGSNWFGSKSLDPNSPGYQVGRMYREARREHAR